MSTIITSIDPDSPAMRAGLRAGQQLLTINGHAVVDCNSYIEWPQWDYRRVKGFGKVELNDIVVFNYPSGDTLCADLRYQPQDFYILCHGLGEQLWPEHPVVDSLTHDEQRTFYETRYQLGRLYRQRCRNHFKSH